MGMPDIRHRDCCRPKPNLENVNRRAELIRNVADRPCRFPLQEDGRCSAFKSGLARRGVSQKIEGQRKQRAGTD
jgi:hypothetical protein